MGARDRIRDFFEANIGKIVTTHQISKVARIRDYQRRIRELRNDEGLQIQSHIDRHDLKPGEYILETNKLLPVVGHGMSPQLRNEILERNGFTCRLCGAGAGDQDEYNPSRKIRLHIDHVVPKSQGGNDSKDNLRVLCSTCNHARSNIQTPSESAVNLITRIRKVRRSVQREVYNALKKSLGE